MTIHKPKLILAGIILIGTILRFYNITSVALWHDEAFSALLIRYPFEEMMMRIGLDVHPPLYYWILRVWDVLFGDSLFSLRAFSAFFGILTVYFAYLFIKTAFKNERLALISALFIAINPFQIQYSTEARMYTLGTFIIILSSWLLVKALESTSAPLQEISQNACKSSFGKCNRLNNSVSEKSGLKGLVAKLSAGIRKYYWWILYGISASAAIYTHYYLMFSIAGQAMFILFLAVKNNSKDIIKSMKSENMRGGIIAYAAAFILFLPWLGIFMKQLGQVEENYWIPKMDIYSIPNTLWKMIASSNIYLNNAWLIAVLIIFLIIFAVAVKREKNNYKYLIVMSFIVPFLLAIALSFKRSLYLDRYFVFAAIFYLSIFALFINSIEKQKIRRVLIAIFVVASIAFFIRNWQNIAPSGKPGMASASAYIFDNAESNDKVYVGSSFVFFTYKYYAYQNFFSGIDFNPSSLKAEDGIDKYRVYPAYVTPLLYTPGIKDTNGMPHFSGTALLTNSDLLHDFNASVNRMDTVWLLWTTGFGSSKPEVPKNWQQVDEAGFEDVLGYRGWIVVTKYKVQ